VTLADLQDAASADWGSDAWWHPGGLAWNQPIHIGRVDHTWIWSDGDAIAILGPLTARVVEWAEDDGAHFLVDHRQLSPDPPRRFRGGADLGL